MARNPLRSSVYWEDRYRHGGDSGVGSRNHLGEYKASILNNFFDRYRILKVVDYGCGDGHLLSQLRIRQYVGYDVSPTIIHKNQIAFARDRSKSFHVIDDVQDDAILHDQSPDAVLSLDVISHLVEDDVFQVHMKRLFTTRNARFVVIYAPAYETNQVMYTRDRKIIAYISDHFRDWEMFKLETNPYKHLPFPYGSFSDFYFYRMKMT